MFSSHVCVALAPGYTNKDDCTWESESLLLLISECILLGLGPCSKYTYIWVCVCVFSSVQSLSRVRLFGTPWITARQASLSITSSQSSLRLTSIESVMPSSHLILGHLLLLLPPIPPSIKVFSNNLQLLMVIVLPYSFKRRSYYLNWNWKKLFVKPKGKKNKYFLFDRISKCFFL